MQVQMWPHVSQVLALLGSLPWDAPGAGTVVSTQSWAGSEGSQGLT